MLLAVASKFEQRLAASAGVSFYIGQFKAVACGITTFTSSDLNVSVAAEFNNRRDAETTERLARGGIPLALPFLKSNLGVTITTPAAVMRRSRSSTTITTSPRSTAGPYAATPAA